MNTLDIIIMILLVFGAVKGFKRGFVFEIAMIIGLITGIYLAFKFSDLIYAMLQKLLNDEGYLLHVVSFFIVFASIILVFIFFAKLMEVILKATALNIFNKLAGGVLGLIKFAFVISVIFWLFLPLQSKTKLIPPKVLKESVLFPYILNTSSWIFPALDDIKDEFKDRLG